MKYANNIKGERIEVSYSKEAAYCPSCKIEVAGRKGKINSPYWRHPNYSCDSWYEPTTEWHISWQNQFPKEWQEIVLFDEKSGEKHIADIQLPNRTVVEIQNSPIDIMEIKSREIFYGKQNNLIWILNGRNLLKQSDVEFRFHKKELKVTAVIPEDASGLWTNRYDRKAFNKMFNSSNLIAKVRKNNQISYKKPKVNYHEFTFSNDVGYDEFILDLRDCIAETKDKLLGSTFDSYLGSQFEISYSKVLKEYYSQIKLTKRYWRKFIDEMRYPIFIDFLKGIPEDSLYYLQENRIVKKKRFVDNLIQKSKVK